MSALSKSANFIWVLLLNINECCVCKMLCYLILCFLIGLSKSRTSSLSDSGDMEVGDRVIVAGQRKGTIRYVGETQFAPGNSIMSFAHCLAHSHLSSNWSTLYTLPSWSTLYTSPSWSTLYTVPSWSSCTHYLAGLVIHIVQLIYSYTHVLADLHLYRLPRWSTVLCIVQLCDTCLSSKQSIVILQPVHNYHSSPSQSTLTIYHSIPSQSIPYITQYLTRPHLPSITHHLLVHIYCLAASHLSSSWSTISTKNSHADLRVYEHEELYNFCAHLLIVFFNLAVFKFLHHKNAIKHFITEAADGLDLTSASRMC